jgi:hypothetical protein
MKSETRRISGSDWKVADMVQQGIRKLTGGRVCPFVVLVISGTPY